MKPGNRAALSLKVAQQTWERILRAEDVDEKVKLFNETVTHMLDTEVPVKTIVRNQICNTFATRCENAIAVNATTLL